MVRMRLKLGEVVSKRIRFGCFKYGITHRKALILSLESIEYYLHIIENSVRIFI